MSTDREFRNDDAPCFMIEAWAPDDRSYITLVMTSEAKVRDAAWRLLRHSYPGRMLILRQGARVMRRREAVD